MPDTESRELKDLINKRSSMKGRLTTFINYITEIRKIEKLTRCQINELKARLKKIDILLTDYDLVQTNIEIKELALSESAEKENTERETTETRFYKAIAEAQEILELAELQAESTSTNSIKYNNNYVKLPKITLPTFDGDANKWLDFRDTYISVIHDNETLPDISKFQYLKSSLKGTAATVIELLELSSKNYEVAWKLICDRFDNKRHLVYTHLKSLFDVPVITKESDKSLRFLVDHISKGLRALNSLDERTDNWDTIIIFMFSAKLDSVTSSRWEEYKNNLENKPQLNDFYEFLRRRADVLEMTLAGGSEENGKQQQNSQHYKRIDKQQKTFVAASSGGSEKNNSKCLVCNGEHLIYYCEKFLAMAPADRLSLIVKLRACLNCLRSGHYAHQCKAVSCKYCKKRHNSLLHLPKETVKGGEEKPIKTLSLSTCVANQVLLSTALVNVTCDNSSQQCEARCLLDCGSQSSFISRDLRDKLGLQGNVVSSVCITGINDISFEALQRCTLTIHSRMNAYSTKVDAFIIDKVTSNLPNCEVDVSCINIPPNISLADPEYYCPARVDLLLGADVFWNIISAEKIKLGTGKPLLHNSMLGWLVAGPVMYNTNFKNEIVCNFSQGISNQLKQFWVLEEVPSKPVLSQEEEACEQHFMQHTRRLEDGRFCVMLPLKIESNQLGDSYCLARKRFDSLEKRFRRQPEVKSQYIDFLREYGDLGHLSQVERPVNAVFLPHHPVLKEQRESTKCRVVFDASAKTSTGLSLNDTMMVGPTVQDDIFSILTRLRQHRYIITGDIEKMYRQIMIEPCQRYLQTILWRENEQEAMKYLQLNTVTYGTSSAPFLSTRCLVQLALECDDPLIKQVMLHDFYIDDLITGSDNQNGLEHVYQRVTESLNSAGFNLRKVKTNSLILLNNINKSSNKEQDNLKISSTTSTLGIEWDPNSDCILIPVSKAKVNEEDKITKRKVLSVSSCIFDPLGLLSVCIITCKMILQLLWQENIGWDDKIPNQIAEMWLKFITNLKLIEKLSIPRHAMCTNPVFIETHTFSDASLKAYAACLYMRSADAVGNVTVRLLCAKAKVAPLKSATIPRLELCGAVLAARLCQKVIESLRCDITSTYFWCDSRVVLGWLDSPAHKLSTFVSHRVAEVTDLCAGSSWRYVPSSMNPADLASRGVYPDEVISLSLWWEGPAFLKRAQKEWPEQTHDAVQTNLPEVRVHVCNVDTPQNSIIDFKKYSSFLKLKRILAYVYRFVNNCRDQSNKNLGQLTTEELENSELKLAYLSQQESFSKYKGNFKNMPKMFNLTPSIDEVGMIRVGGRIDNSQYCYDKRHPIVLDAKHHLTRLILEYYHIQLLHAGPQLLLSVVREHYWPIGGRMLARRVCNSCIKCRRMKGVVAKQIMGNLPGQRLSPGFPFEITGTDYAGPFMIVNKKGRGARLLKCYLCVFVCFKTKAVHLELVSELTTEAFILALRRFMSRRGKPREIFCDNGTNFVGANRAICDMASVSDIADEGIKFRFSPVYTPHFGGLYEAAVKSAKFHMKRVLGNTHLTFEELTTLFSQIEAILNSRPLIPMSSDPNDLCPLTPGHFLIGRPLTSLPSPDLQDANPNRLHRYARIEQARQHFWSRWSREYICELQQRSKWQQKQPDITPDQMVLIRDDSNPPMKWPLGRVTATYPGTDGACRVADVKTSKGIMRRAIHKLCPLLDVE